MAKNQMPMPPKAASEQSEAVTVSDDQEQPSSKPIKVVALRPGFWMQERKKPGDRFEVVSMEKVGAWMRCEDPSLEKKHQANQRARLKKANELSADEE